MVDLHGGMRCQLGPAAAAVVGRVASTYWGLVAQAVGARGRRADPQVVRTIVGRATGAGAWGVTVGEASERRTRCAVGARLRLYE